MADVTDIGEIVKKCKILLLDIEGTTTSITFVKDKLFPYAEEHVKQFLSDQWETDDVKEVVAALRALAVKDKEESVEGLIAIPGEDTSKEEQIEGLVSNVKWQMSSDRKTSALKTLQGLIWKQGYDNGDIKGHVYDDVPAALENWRSVDGRKVFIYSSGSVKAQQLLFGQSLAGNLLARIDGHFDTAVGPKQESCSYTAIVEKIGCKPEEILFLTDIEKEAEAAKAAGLHVALVSREGNAPLAATASVYPLLHSLAQLACNNKRKTETEIQEETPAKVAKTDTEDGVNNGTTDKQTPKTSEAPESMEVDESTVEKAKEIIEPEATEESAMQVETIIEEITDPNDKIDLPVCDIEPVVIDEKVEAVAEISEKDDKMKTNSVAPTTDATEAVNGDQKPKTEVVVTAIEEITCDTSIVEEVVDIIEDLEPVIEEPELEDPDLDSVTSTANLENLKSAGQALEKECDEILSKVHDVTNLEDITMKPALNTIAEESLDTALEFEFAPETETMPAPDEDKLAKGKTMEYKPKDDEPSDDKPTEDKSSDDKLLKDKLSDAEPSDDKPSDNKFTDAKPLNDKLMDDKHSDDKLTDTKPSDDKLTDTKPSDDKVTDTTKPTDDKLTDDKLTDTKLSDSKLVESELTVDDVDGKGTSASEDDKTQIVEPKTVPAPKEKVENAVEEIHVNGNTTNGDSAPAVNGDDLNSRLAMENGGDSADAEVNGAADDAAVAQAKDDKKESEAVTDIKVKSVPTEETHTDSKEQTSEA